MLFAVYIFFSAAEDRRSEFYNHLAKEAASRAYVLLDAGVEPETLQTIYRQNREILSEVEVAIYDPYFNLLYHDAEDLDFVKETPEMIDEIVETGEIRFVQEGWEVIGILVHYQETPYVVTAAAYDEYGHSKLANLRNTLIFAWVAGVFLVFLAGKFFSRGALKPVLRMAEKAGEITATNLDLRLSEGNRKDELDRLAVTFNRMLDRLENSFDAQKEFVSNISHELRTPLTAIIGEIELTLSREKTPEEYREALEKLLHDAKRLSTLTTGLLDLARASYQQSELSLREARLDEILMDARGEMLASNPGCRVEINFEESLEDQSTLTIRGNEYLLKVAFLNLMDNGCKFSPGNVVKVRVGYQNGQCRIEFADKGIGIPEEELARVFDSFYRGKNAKHVGGSGIGLSLVKRIADLHRGSIAIESVKEEGTRVILNFPVLPNS